MLKGILMREHRLIFEERGYLIQNDSNIFSFKDKEGKTLFEITDENNSDVLTLLLKDKVMYCKELIIAPGTNKVKLILSISNDIQALLEI